MSTISLGMKNIDKSPLRQSEFLDILFRGLGLLSNLAGVVEDVRITN